MRNYFIYILLFCSLFSYSQNFGELYTCGFHDSSEVINGLIEKTKFAKKIRSVDSYYISKNDTLIYYLKDSIDGFTIFYVFNLTNDDNEKLYCNYQKINFNCSKCSNSHLKEIINYYHFRKISENVYLSNFNWHTKMFVNFDELKNNCMTITYVHYDLPIKEYKSLYKKLRKER